MNSKPNSIFLVSLAIGLIGFSIGGFVSSSPTSLLWFFTPVIFSFLLLRTLLAFEQVSEARHMELMNLNDAILEVKIAQKELAEFQQQRDASLTYAEKEGNYAKY